MASTYERAVGRLIVRNSDRLIAVSDAVARHAVRLGAEPESVRVIANGVDVGHFKQGRRRTRRTFRVACVGRLIFNKGPEYLVEAAPEILRAHPDVEFVFVGDGPLRSDLERRARTLGVAHRVSFLGTQRDVAGVLRRCDVLARPSLLEGMPLTVLEAMACGLPVVATPVSGTAELVRHGENGLLVPPGDYRALAAAIIRLVEDPELRKAQGRNGRRLVARDYSWDAVAEQNLALYEDLLSARAGAAAPLPEAA